MKQRSYYDTGIRKSCHYNWCYNYNLKCNASFFEVSIAQLLTPFIALCFAFIAVQYKNDQCKAKEHAEKILLHIQEIVKSEAFYAIPARGQVGAIQKDINLTNRKISNYIAILQGYSKSLGFASELKYNGIIAQAKFDLV